MQAIKTEYKGPTDHKGSRIIASSDATRVTFHYEYALSAEENHKRAAFLLSEKLGWHDGQTLTHHVGGHKNAYYHIFTRKDS